MKKLNVIFALLAYLVAAGNTVNIPIAAETAKEIVNALRSTSSKAYVNLFPTVEEFHHLMEAHESSYGSYLVDAQVEFDLQYKVKILPRLKESFESFLKQGEERGIVWGDVQLAEVKLDNHSQRLLNTATLSIAISHRGMIYRIVIEDALLVNGRLCVGRSIRFA